MRKFLLIIIFIFFATALPCCGQEKASLYLSPTNGTFFTGSTFDVSIFVNTGGKNINAVKVDLKFDPKKLQIASPTAGKSFISIWVSQPAYSNSEGTASFRGGIPSPGINTSAGLVSSITFRAVSPGKTEILILDSSKVLLDDGQGTDILGSLSKGEYEILIPPPEGPKVYSSTHPDPNKWYKNNSPSFSWDKEEGVLEFSYSIDRDFHGEPDNISEGEHSSISYTNLEDGIWYFHVKAKKGNNWGGTSHYLVQIDKTEPADFKISFEPVLKSGVVASKEPIVYFFTTDALSGIDHFEVKVIDLEKNIGEQEETAFFIEAGSPHKLPELAPGSYKVIVRAYDKSLNYRDVSERIEITPVEKIVYKTNKGISIFNFFLSWKKISVLFIIIIIVLLIPVFVWYKKHKNFIKKRESVSRLMKKAEKEKNDIENQLYEK